MIPILATGHTISGVLMGAATAPVLGVTPADPVFWAWTGIIAGAALLPDLDMKRSVADTLLGPITGGVRWGSTTLVPGLWSFVRPFLGGHRGRTHRISGVLLFLAGLFLCTLWLWPSVVVVVLATALAVRALALVATYLFDFRYRKHYWIPLTAVSGAVGWWFYGAGVSLPLWVVWAMAAGCAVHIAGDGCTDSGVKLTAQAEKPWRLLPEKLCFKAGGWVEHTLVLPPMLIASVLVVAYQAGYDPVGAVIEGMRNV